MTRAEPPPSPAAAQLRKQIAAQEAEIKRLRHEVARLQQEPKAATWPAAIREAQRVGFSFGVAHGMDRTLAGIRAAIGSLNVAATIADGLAALDKKPDPAPKPAPAKKGKKKP